MLTDHPFAPALPLADRLRLLADDLRDDALAVVTLQAAADLADQAALLIGPANATPLPDECREGRGVAVREERSG